MTRNIRSKKVGGGAMVTPHVARMAAPASVQKEKQEQSQVGQNANTAQNEVEIKLEAAMQQKQSQELVQIMLNASIGSLFYLRGFLPLTCFDTRYLETQSESNPSYEDFVGPSAKTGASRKSQPLRILLRNRDATADAVLDLLEYGIFDALGKRVLEAVQLTISRDKDKPLQVLESYTFTFAYNHGDKRKAGNLRSVTLGNDEFTMEMATFRSAKIGLEMVIRRLITLSTILPNLPSKRFLHVHLFYTEDCPSDYEPPGFKYCALENISYPRIENWTKETQSCGVMDGPFHRVGLKVTSLRWSGTGNDQIPENLDYSDGASRECDIDTDHSSEYLDEARNCSQDDSQEDFETTQGRKDAADKRILQKMLEPSSVDTSMIPTQGLSNPAAKENALAAKPKLSQIRVSEIERERNQLSTIRLTDTKSNGSHSNNRFGGAINCQCGFDKEEEYMLYCRFCDTKQHLACYGFLDLQDPRLPDTHACYRCLLEPGEKELLREMSTLVLLRRALKVIMEEGYPNRTKVFAEKLHCNGQTIVQITELLKKRGLLKATPGYKSKGFAEKGLPSFVIPEAQDVHETIDQEIFNPLAKISHHYILPQASHSASSEEHHQRSEYGREFHPVFGTYRERSRRRLWPLDEGICRSREASTASASSSPKVERQAFMSGRRQNQGRKRKLSNAAQPLDVGEHDDELMDASSS